MISPHIDDLPQANKEATGSLQPQSLDPKPFSPLTAGVPALLLCLFDLSPRIT